MNSAFVFRSATLLLRHNVNRSASLQVRRGLASTPRRRRAAYSPERTISSKTIKCDTDGHRFNIENATPYQMEHSTIGPTEEDTIFALSSGAGVTAGVAIIRISGPSAKTCLLDLLKRDSNKFPAPRHASFRRIYHPTTVDLLDEAIVIFFPGPRSFTGEDVVELHVHGSRAVINAVFEALEKIETNNIIRPAERGEFTRRAFENGRMDLTRVEGLADLISAETSMQRKQALRQLSGEVCEMLESWRAEIKTCLAHAEAVIDFGDDVDDDAFESIVPRVRELHQKLRVHLNDGHRGEIVRGGARVAIVGEPNAGKSTLLNALARRPAAIVSPLAGTTRDVVEVQLDINGLPVIVCDTAGLRDRSDDPIEVEGMHRAKRVASEADITILVHDGTTGRLEDAIAALPRRLGIKQGDSESRNNSNDKLICVINKIDISLPDPITTREAGLPVFRTSLLRNEGLTDLVSHLEKHLRERVEGLIKGNSEEESYKSTTPVITRARHRYHMNVAVRALESFLEGRSGPDRSLYLPMDLATEDLRIAGRELGSITGTIHVEEILDVIFSEFCIGK